MPANCLHIIWIAIFVLFPFLGNSQTKLFTNDEIPSEHVYRILQDKEGYIWILTEEGIVKYNGTEIKTIAVKDGLPTNDIFNGYFTDNNQFWFICKGNELGYIENDSVFSYKLPQLNTINTNGINHRKNEVVYHDANGSQEFTLINKKWNFKNLSFKKNRFNHFLNLNTIFYGKITKQGSCSFFNKENQPLFSIYDPSFDPGNQLHQYSTFKNCLTLRTGSIVYFINTLTYEVKKLDLSKFKEIRLYINYIHDQFQITGKNFVVKLNDNYEIEEEYQFDSIYEAHANFIDREGNLWLGSMTTGVHFMTKEAYLSELKDEKKDIKQSELINDKLYYTNFKGVTEFNSYTHFFTEKKYFTTLSSLNKQLFIGKHRDVDTKHQFKTQQINTETVTTADYSLAKILQTKNSIYSITFNVLYQYDTNFVFNNYKTGHFGSLAICNDSLIYGNNNGLFYNEGDKSFRNFDKPIKSLVNHKDKLYIGTNGFGLFVYGNNAFKNYPLNNTTIKNILIHQDSLVFCSTNKGVICLKQIGDSIYPYYLYEKKDGLVTNHVNKVHIDSKDNMYIATKKGILKPS